MMSPLLTTTPSRSVNDVFSRIKAVSQSLMDVSSAYSSKTHPSSLPEHPAVDCIFPQPKSLRLDLDLGLDHDIAEKFESVYMRAAMQLKADHEKQLRRAICRGLTPRSTESQLSLYSAFISSYTKRLNSWVEQIKDHTERVFRARQRQRTADISVHSRRSFSQHVISILERFFEHNAFPSRLEKHNLATETNLTYYQVHVWFQNHRRRFRKEGKELKKGDPVLNLPAELETSVVELLALSEPKLNLRDETVNAVDTHAVGFNLEAPHHAFPSAYPPVCSYDPFPIEDGVRKFTTPWIRSCSPISAGRSVDFDVTQLTALFKKMSLLDEPLTVASHHCLSEVLGFTTITPRAPHPALIPTGSIPAMLRLEAPTLHISLGAGTSGSLCPQTMIQTKQGISRRKFAALPRRVPTSASVQGVSRAISKGSMPSSALTSSIISTMSSNSLVSSQVSHPRTRTTDDSSSKSPRHTSAGRKIAALPKHASARPPALYNLRPSPPGFVSLSSRTSSASSSTSSGSSSPSGLDTPLSTPPSLTTSLPPSKTSLSCTLEPASSFSFLFDEYSADPSLPTEGLQLRLEATLRVATHISL